MRTPWDKTHPFVVHYERVQMRPTRSPHTPFALNRRLRKSREGIDWAWGWDGEEVEALLVTWALR